MNLYPKILEEKCEKIGNLKERNGDNGWTS